MFLEHRVYQGSSGTIYPLPFTDRIAEEPVPRKWKAFWIENEYLRVLVLPELGGRIHAIQDKTNGYDLIYRQDVIKPALVGLAGPWASGGIEFNWPQHHRPATFLPVETAVERHPDGSVTLWCGDHDPMARMKGMHGVCLSPGRAWVELKVRLHNRTPLTQTFLWWANVATSVHEAYQSFFPPDVYYVADHARRSMSQYPLAQGLYYGVDYGQRGRSGIPPDEAPVQFVPPHCKGGAVAGDSARNLSSCPLPNYPPNDLSFYANIPVPTSYMCMGSKEDFSGGYDYRAQAGIVHIASHHISPGKKQWTWGNHEFGYAWDRNLTEPDARGVCRPYLEIMAGVYTDNQPDFSFLQPGETKAWSQYWYPIQKIGPACHATLDAALALRLLEGASPEPPAAWIGVSATREFPRAKVLLTADGAPLFSAVCDLAPGKPFARTVQLPAGCQSTSLRLCALDAQGREVIAFQPKPRASGKIPPPAAEPPAPEQIASADELFVTGLHLDQYRHATRSPTLYWREALRRDPGDARCNTAMGRWHFRRGEFAAAEACLLKALERMTLRNANPPDGEASYHLGLCLRHLGRDTDAYDALYKATWNQAWAGAASHALAEIDCGRNQWALALDHLETALRLNTDNLRARNLKVLVLRQLGRAAEAARCLRQTRRLDPLDGWSRYLARGRLECDLQAQLDLAHDYARAGLHAQAVDLLQRAGTAGDSSGQSLGAQPLVHYTLGWLEEKRGRRDAALNHYQHAAALDPDYCFPARLEEIAILEAATRANPQDARAPYYLGNLLYDRRRHEEAIGLWERSAKLDPSFSIVWRNLGIGYFNVRRQPARARAAYDKAVKASPNDARLLYERDQLAKRLGLKPGQRLRQLARRLDLVRHRDDLCVELCALYNQTGQPEQALALVSSRRFQPWEGGEGGPLGQWARSHLALGRRALAADDAPKALAHFQAALTAPLNLGEARHPLASPGDIHYWLGCALALLGEREKAAQHWQAAANFKGDFQEMRARPFSEMTYYSALAWEKLRQAAKAKQLLRGLLDYALRLEQLPALIDYFATSLPSMLLFDDDPQARQQTTALFLQAQARLGLRQSTEAAALLERVLNRDPNHPLAADLTGTAAR